MLSIAALMAWALIFGAVIGPELRRAFDEQERNSLRKGRWR